ncbi:hypothetical protein MPSEU_000457600 [Mayamaea pseudoterrestris]|nr:hypothetical protein MPSEU_000457600 [Mayamaea pseudoterrestris]
MMFPTPGRRKTNDKEDEEANDEHDVEHSSQQRAVEPQAWPQKTLSVQDDEKLTDSGASDSLPESKSTLRSSPTSIYAQTMGLHQRQRHFRAQQDAADDSSVNREDNFYFSDYNSSAHNKRPFDGSPDNKYGKQRYAAQYPAKKRRAAVCGTRTQSILLALALAYLALAIYMYKRVTSNDDYYFRDPKDSEQLLELVHQMEKLSLARAFLDEREAISRRSARKLHSQRETSRISRSRPVANLENVFTADEQHVGLADIDGHAGADSNAGLESISHSEPASLEALCGFHAQNASLTFPNNYLSRDAVGTRSRILITGITDMLGLRLALLLHQRCRARVVAAIDPTFPNTIPNRLRLLEPLQVLAKHVPKLNILWGYVGLDPFKREENVLLNATGEIDIVRTFRPTHIVHLANFFQSTEHNNLQHPYVKLDGEQYQPSLYHVRSSLAAMEQILMSIASTGDERTRPNFVYVSSQLGSTLQPFVENASRDTIAMSQTHKMQEIMANAYYSSFGVQSTAIRLPDVVFGPWHSVQSPMHQILLNTVGNQTNASSYDERLQDFLYVDDVAEALIAAMQFRSPHPKPFALEPVGKTTWQAINKLVHSISESEQAIASSEDMVPAALATRPDFGHSRQYLSWFPRTTISEGVIRTLAWYLDQTAPPPPLANANHSSSALSGDGLLARHSLPSCPLDDPSCRIGSTSHPCASECSYANKCSTSMFDSMLNVVHDVTEGCEIVLYTQLLVKDASDFKLHTEYMDEGTPLICTVAFVAFESPLVQSVVQKVPDHEQVQLGVIPRPEDYGSQDALHNLKRIKLNGRLLYQGWILVWPDEVPDPLPHALKYLVKLAPGRLFSESVKQAVFIEESFGVSPKHDDIKFLVQQLKRDALPKRTVKKKTPPKTKIRLPAEPSRRAVILMSELRHQESYRSESAWKDKISIRQASRFMRFECGERSLGKEPSSIKAQREFYERIVSFVNRNTMRSPLEPPYTFAMKHWARTRWVVHDLELAEGRQLRCDWYKEHTRWEGSSVDQLSFAYVMAKRELARRLTTEAELTDRGLKALADWTEIKRLLTDVFEWYPLLSERNKDYTPYGEVTALPYDHVDSEEGNIEGTELIDEEPLLFARIISDRVMTLARKEWYAPQRAVK